MCCFVTISAVDPCKGQNEKDLKSVRLVKFSIAI